MKLVDPMWHCTYVSHMNRRKLNGDCHKQLLAYFSGFWTLITLLFLSTAPVNAEWVVVEKDYLLSGIQREIVKCCVCGYDSGGDLLTAFLLYCHSVFELYALKDLGDQLGTT